MDHSDYQDDPEQADRQYRQAEKEIEDLGLSQVEFDNLERDFQTVIHELSGEKSLERFRMEYEKLHKTLKTSHETEKRMIKRCKELNSEISSNMSKVQVALKLSQEDAMAITQIQQDVKRTWKAVDEAREKEEELNKRGKQLREEYAELSRKIENDDTTPVAQQELLQRLIKEKEQVEESKLKELEKLKLISDRNADLQKRVADNEGGNQSMEQEIKDKIEQIEQERIKAKNEEARKNSKDKELEQLRQDYQAAQAAIERKSTQRQELQDTIQQQRASLKVLQDQKNKLEQDMKKQSDVNKTRQTSTNKLQENQTKQLKKQEILSERIAEKREEEEMKVREREKTLKEIAVMNKKNAQMTKDDKDLEYQKDKVKLQLVQLQRANDDKRRQNEKDRKAIEDMMREIHQMNKKSIRTENEVRVHKDEIMMKRNEQKKIENEVKGSKNEAGKINVLINQLEHGREKYALEASNAYSKYFQSLEQVKYKNSMIAKCQKDNQDAESRLKQLQNLYEAVRSDRNIYSKALNESTQEIQDLQRRYKILRQTIDKAREEIGVKNNEIRVTQQQLERVINENEQAKEKLQNLKKKKENFDEQIKKYDEQINKLKTYVDEAEQERIKQEKEYQMVTKDRNILGNQLIKRNEELAQLYEKIKIQQSTLAKGDAQYQEKVLESTRITNQIIELKRELLVAKNQISCLPELKREVYQMQKELMEAKTKVKALSEELSNPMNVHRYRKLEGTNPERYEMINKIQTLQRRLIAKTEEVAEKDFLIQEKERLYIELKNILARQPGPEVEEQLEVYQGNLKDKSKQMAKMLKELKQYHAQVNQYRFEIERLSKELSGLKAGWFDQQKIRRKTGVDIS